MSDEEKKEMVGYRQQPGKISFSRPGSGARIHSVNLEMKR